MSETHEPEWIQQLRDGEFTLLNTTGGSSGRRSHHQLPSTARQRLVESSGTPFAPGPEVRLVVEVIDGRKRNDEIEPTAWSRALEAAEGSVTVYFGLGCDHEWWLAYDPIGEYPGAHEGPYHLWTTYPTGGWNHSALPSFDHHLEDVYGMHDRDRECEIYRSKTVRLEDAPAFVQQEVSDHD